MTDASDSRPSYSLDDLAQEAGVKPRTVRSWIEQDLLPGPASRGPGAHYSGVHRRRIRLITALRDDAGLPLATIRRLLVARTPLELDALPDDGRSAARQLGYSAPAPSRASDYLDAVLAGGSVRPAPAPAPSPPPPPADGARTARAERWWRIAVTADVELHVRALPDPDSRLRFERIADRLRAQLLGGST